MGNNKPDIPVLLSIVKDKVLHSPRFFIIKKQCLQGEGAEITEYYLFGLVPIYRSIRIFDQYKL